jgi:4-alpha-glucanotransferase
MVASFAIEYRTNWGEKVCLAVKEDEPESKLPELVVELHTADGVHWNADAELNAFVCSAAVSYHYFIADANGRRLRSESETLSRHIVIKGGASRRFITNDYWLDAPKDAPLYSSAFTEAIKSRPQRDEVKRVPTGGTVTLRLYAPNIDSNLTIAVCGASRELGAWDDRRAMVMNNRFFPEWQATIPVGRGGYNMEYKYVLYDAEGRTVKEWEHRDNRSLYIPQLSDNDTLMVNDVAPDFGIGQWRGAGVAIPVFSLRSEGSCGIGDFGDLTKMVDWAALCGMKLLQILPINDTTMTHTWTDSYPYNSISIYAFHPLYIDVRQLGPLSDDKKAKELERRRQKLNALAEVDYEAVEKLKWEYINLHYKQDGEATLRSEGFADFYRTNGEWLRNYAVFSLMRDRYATANFRDWPHLNSYDAAEVERLCTPGSADYEAIGVYMFVQYHLHLQLKRAAEYARHHHVALKGDIPIGISRDSVEAWAEPHYFNLNGQAGAPPDDFSVNGQNWGFPTYNWELMEQDGYSWWMKRFRKMSEYFDAYRIDHVLGFFRIWEIPTHSVHGLLGQFAPALPMTREEIIGYGLNFSEDMTEPYISDWVLSERFGERADYVKSRFVEPTPDGRCGGYRMREEFNTQRKVERYFRDNAIDDPELKEGLYALISNVLFVRDRLNPQTFHPRISANLDYAFRALADGDKWCFGNLYEQYYYHRHNDFWRDAAMKKLPRLTQSTRMLVCGEDLGMIPACVESVMNELRILSLEIPRMPKEVGYEFGNVMAYPYRSVSTFSTHDMSTLRGWWREDREKTQHFFNNVMRHCGEAPMEISPEQCEEVMRGLLYAPSMLCVPSFQDWMSVDGFWRNPDVDAERINVPANPKNYWHYRMHLTLEQLMAADSVNAKISALIVGAGR